MAVSVIVSTYTKKRTNDVLKCLESLESQELIPDEILLVLDPDDELVKHYKKACRDYKVKIVKSEGYGLSKARNTGVRISKGDIIAFIDDDAWADKLWLKSIIKNFEDPDVYGVGGRIVPAFDGKRPKWLPEELDWVVGCTYKGMPENRAEIRNPIGANMAFRREAFEEIGLFRSEVGRYGNKLLSGEEAEFAMRLKKLKPNVKIIYEPSAIVYHRVPKNKTKLGYVLRRAYYEGFSKALLSKEYSLKNEASYLKFLLIRSVPGKVIKLKFSEILGIIVVISMVGFGNIYGIVRRCWL